MLILRHRPRVVPARYHHVRQPALVHHTQLRRVLLVLRMGCANLPDLGFRNRHVHGSLVAISLLILVAGNTICGLNL